MLDDVENARRTGEISGDDADRLKVALTGLEQLDPQATDVDVAEPEPSAGAIADEVSEDEEMARIRARTGELRRQFARDRKRLHELLGSPQ